MSHWEQRKLKRRTRQLVRDYLVDHPDATNEEIQEAVASELSEEFGVGIDIDQILQIIEFIRKLLDLFKR